MGLTNQEKLKKLQPLYARAKAAQGTDDEKKFAKFMAEYKRVKKLVDDEELERQEAEALAEVSRREAEALAKEKKILEKQNDTKSQSQKESVKNAPVELRCDGDVETVKPTHAQTAAMPPEKRLEGDTLDYGEDLLNCKDKIKKIRKKMGQVKANSNDFWTLKRILDAEQETYFELRDKWTMKKQEERDQRFDTLQEINVAKMTEMVTAMVEMCGTMKLLAHSIDMKAQAEVQQLKDAEESMKEYAKQVTEATEDNEVEQSEIPLGEEDDGFAKEPEEVELEGFAKEGYPEDDYRSMAGVPADKCHHAERDEETGTLMCIPMKEECAHIFNPHDCSMSDLCTFKRDTVSIEVRNAVEKGGKKQCRFCEKWFKNISSHFSNNAVCKIAMLKEERKMKGK